MSEFINTVDNLGDDAVCDGIITRSLTEYKENRITSIGDYVFYDCSAITEADIPNVTSVGVFAFYGCSAMKTINIPIAESISNYAFYNNYALNSINMPLVTAVGKSAFRYCNTMTNIDMPLVTSIDTYAFYNCTVLTTVVLRSETMCEISSTNVFGNTPIASGTGYIYVPDDLVETYQLGTNWSTYAAQIKGLSELEE